MPQRTQPYETPRATPDRIRERYDPGWLDALSDRHAELLRDLAEIRVRFGERSVATALLELSTLGTQVRGYVETLDAFVLAPLARDWRGDARVSERIARSRERWQELVAMLGALAETIAAIDLGSTDALAKVDFRFAEAAHRLGDAFRADRSSLFLLFLAPHRAPTRTR